MKCSSTCQGMPCELEDGHERKWHVYLNAEDEGDDGPLEWLDVAADRGSRK